MVWVGAIALFFNRWGKIRMLLPYQPDYKEQLKVPGTGAGNSVNSAYNHSSSQQVCSQVMVSTIILISFPSIIFFGLILPSFMIIFFTIF